MSDLYRGRAPVNGYRDLDTSPGPAAAPAFVVGDAPADRREEPARDVRPSVDHGMVREIRRQVAERLAARLQETPRLPVEARRELGRSLVARVLEERARQRAHAGE